MAMSGGIRGTRGKTAQVRFWEALTGKCFHVLDHGGICKVAHRTAQYFSEMTWRSADVTALDIWK